MWQERETKIELKPNDKRAFYTLMFPVFIEQVIVRLFQIVDSIMIGQMTDSTVAVAAVGLCNSPINLIGSVSNAFFVGTTGYFGVNEKRKMRWALHRLLRRLYRFGCSG